MENLNVRVTVELLKNSVSDVYSKKLVSIYQKQGKGSIVIAPFYGRPNEKGLMKFKGYLIYSPDYKIFKEDLDKIKHTIILENSQSGYVKELGGNPLPYRLLTFNNALNVVKDLVRKRTETDLLKKYI